MSREEILFLNDMLLACQKIQRYSKGLTKDQFFAEEKTYDAVLRNIEIIGEATKQLSQDYRSQHPDVDWRKIAGLRDVVIHQYFGLDAHILWDIVTQEIPALETQLNSLLKP